MFVNDIFKKKQLDEGGPFGSTEPKKPRKGSVADLAAQKRKEQERGRQPIEPKDQRVGTAKVVKEFLDDRNQGDDDGGNGRGRKSPKARARAQVLKMYGDGDITFRKTSNGGYFIQHEDDFGDTNSHQYDPQTGRVDFSGGTSSSYYGEGVAEGFMDTLSTGPDGKLTAKGEEQMQRYRQQKREQEKQKIIAKHSNTVKGQPYGVAPSRISQSRNEVDWKAANKELRKKGLDEEGVTEGSLNEFAPSGGGGGRWYSDDQLYEIIGEDWLEAFDVSGDQGNIDLRGERARLFLAQEAEAWLTDRGYRVNVLDVKDDGDSLSWYIQGPLYRGMAEGAQVTKLNDYDTWSDKVDALGAEKYPQKNRTLIVAQSWDGEKVGEFDTRSNQGWVMSQSMDEGSAQDKLYRRHQDLRKKSGLPDPDYYKELKKTYDMPHEERVKQTAELKKKYNVTNEDRERYIEELSRAGYEIVNEKRMTCPECGGAAYSNRMLAEKQDACYHKVKSRYKVWPSAYASGALVRCRKKGAKNWGNKSK